MAPRLLAACSPGEVRVAAIDGALTDYAIWRPGRPDGVGDLHRARIIAAVPAMAGAFVQLDGEEGFLPDSAGAAGLTAGTMLAVRVTRAAQGGKGPRLTARLDAAEEGLADAAEGPPRLLRRAPGAVERLAAQYPTAPVAVDDPAIAALLRPALSTRLALVPRAFDEVLETELAALAAPETTLPTGVRLTIEPTRALTAIDVDAGAATFDRRPKATAQAELNRLLLPELARQIRLRNLSGAIVIDLAGLSPRRRAALGPLLAASLASDPLRPRFLGFSALGLAELVRPRVHPPLHELLTSPHAAGLAALRRVLSASERATGHALALRAAPLVVAALEADTVALDDVARRVGRLVLRSDPTLPPTGTILESP